MSFVVVLVVLLTPLIISPGFSFYFDVVPKTAVLLCGAALLLLLGASIPAVSKGFAEARFGRHYAIGLFASIVISLLAMSLAVDPLGAWNGSNWRRFGTLEQLGVITAAWLISAICAHVKPLRATVLRSMCIAGVVAATYGILQYFGQDPFLPSSGYQAGEGIFRIVRPPSTLGHSDYFAAWLIWPCFAGVALFVTEELRLWKIFGIASTLSAAIALLLSGSRGAALGLAVGALVYAAIARVRVRTVGVFLVSAMAMSALLFLSPAGRGLRARAHWIGEDPTGGARPLLWRDSLRMSLGHPWAGVGPDLFSAEFPKYQSAELARAYPNFYHESPHNSILDTLTSSGVFAVFALLLVFATGVRAGLNRIHEDRALGSVLVSALTAVFVAQQFAVFTVPTALYFYLGAGLLAGLDHHRAAALSVSSTYRRSHAVMSFGAAALFAICGAGVVVADHSLAVAKRSLDSGDAQGAVRSLRLAKALRSAGVTADLYFSRRWAVAAMQARNPLARAQFAQFARTAAINSTELQDQRQNAWYNLAMLAAANNDLIGAESSLRSAISCAPRWFKPHWSLARVLFATGRLQEARAEAALAMNLNAGKDSEVNSTLTPILSSQRFGK